MTTLREAVSVPGLFLATFLLAGFRGGAVIQLVFPPPVALVLAVLLVGALVRSGVLEPWRLVSSRRTPLENASGIVVSVTLFLASAQALNVVVPESGLFHAAFAVLLGVQLLTTLASLRDRAAMLRSLAVLLGSAFVLRFVILEALFAPQPGFVKRVVAAAVEGVSLGSLTYTPTGRATGYVAFAALALYLFGLVLIGAPAPTTALVRSSSQAQLPKD